MTDEIMDSNNNANTTGCVETSILSISSNPKVRWHKFDDNKDLFPFQLESISKMCKFLQEENNCVYNACEMGLGKSAQAITCVNTLDMLIGMDLCDRDEAQRGSKTLIICPSIMKYTWQAEILKWCSLKNPRIKVIENSKINFNTLRELSNELSVDFLILSYDLAAKQKICNYITHFEWDVLILDEAHYLKNPKAIRTKQILNNIWPKCKYKIALSGTPFTQSIVDGYTIFSKMLPNHPYFKDFHTFAERFSDKRQFQIGFKTITKYYGVKNHEELSKIMRDNFYIRYKKADVLKELPNKIYTKISLPPEYLYKFEDKEKENACLEAVKFVENCEVVSVTTTALATLRRLQGELKFEPVKEFVRDMLENKIPVVLFCHHLELIDKFAEAFKSYKPSVIIGGVDAKTRTERVADFQEGRTDLFIGQMQASGVGITLTRSSNVVLAEIDWSPGVLSQCVDRCHRIGQKDSVNVYYFVVPNSIDERIVDVVIEKTKSFSKVADGEETRSNIV